MKIMSKGEFHYLKQQLSLIPALEDEKDNAEYELREKLLEQDQQLTNIYNDLVDLGNMIKQDAAKRKVIKKLENIMRKLGG